MKLKKEESNLLEESQDQSVDPPSCSTWQTITNPKFDPEDVIHSVSKTLRICEGYSLSP